MLMLLALSLFAVTGSVVSTVAEAQDGQAQEEGFNDWGLLGLLGLGGLAGLRRNKNENDNRNRR